MKFELLFVILAFSFAVGAQDVLELGELRIQGDIRRPTVDFYHLKSLSPQQVEELAAYTFEEFEKQLLCQNEKGIRCEIH